MKRHIVSLLLLALLVSLSVSGANAKNVQDASSYEMTATEGLVSGVPYVWQEINGFCAWAATSMAVQAAGVDLTLHDVFAASTIGFSFSYVNYNDTILMYPGALYLQAEPTQFLCDMYGLNLTVFFDVDTPAADTLYDVWTSRDITTYLLQGEEGAFTLMRYAIDIGFPLLISVDPSWLPAEDYNDLRSQGLTGGGHAVLIVGYNDTGGYATIMDPGVGSFGNNFGYPEDGRGEYAEISYTALNNAWLNRYYICMLITPWDKNDPIQPNPDRTSEIGKKIRDKMLGVPAAYYADTSTALLWDFGEGAFRAMSHDLSREGIAEYLDIFTGISGEREFKASILEFIGIGLEAQVTLQCLSYRASLATIPRLLPDANLTDFLAYGKLALSHFDALANNATLVYPGNFTQYDGFVYETFHSLATSYNATGNLSQGLVDAGDDLDTICWHLEEIANSWLAAGNALLEIWPNDFLSEYGLIVVIGAAAIGVLAVIVVLYIKRVPSQ